MRKCQGYTGYVEYIPDRYIHVIYLSKLVNTLLSEWLMSLLVGNETIRSTRGGEAALAMATSTKKAEHVYIFP